MNTNDKMIVFSEDFIERVERLGDRILQREQKNSQKKTPKSRIKTKGQFETVEEDYLRAELTREFNGLWSYVPMTQETMLMKTSRNDIQYETPYAEKTLGYLEILDNGIPRKFPAPGYQRYQYRSGAPMTPDNLLNPETTPRGAWSRGLAYAINRLTRIADDVYNKSAAEYELKPELQQQINQLLQEAKINDDEHLVEQVQNRIARYGALKDIPEDIAINIIKYLISNKEVNKM